MPSDSKKYDVMTVGSLKAVLAEFEVTDNFEIWLSSDAEGNQLLPMPANPEWSLAVDKRDNTVTLFPWHR